MSSERPAPRRPQPAPPGSLLTPDEIDRLFARLAEVNPAPRTELAYADPFTLLVAVVLSAQATDLGVNKATKALFAAAPTPAAMVALGEEGIREHIKTIGLFRNKARNVLALSQALLERHGGQVPRARDALEALPGVGRKTANVVLNEAFGEPTIAVDTHVFRVANRTGLAPGKTPEAVEATLERVVPAQFKRGAHHWLILHGRYVCIARRPDCPACVVRDICRFPDKTPPPDGRGQATAQGRRAGSERVVAADHARGGQRAAGQPPLGRAHPPGQHRLRLRQHLARTGRITRPIVQPAAHRRRSTAPAARRNARSRSARRTGQRGARVARQPERPLERPGHDVAEIVLPVRGVPP